MLADFTWLGPNGRLHTYEAGKHYLMRAVLLQRAAREVASARKAQQPLRGGAEGLPCGTLCVRQAILPIVRTSRSGIGFGLFLCPVECITSVSST